MKKRTFWQFWKNDWTNWAALVFIFIIGVPSIIELKYYPGLWLIVILMTITLFVLIFKSIQTWRRDG